MASFPSVAVTRTLKLDPDFRKHPTTEKSPSFSYQRNQTLTHLDGSSEKRSVDFREALSMMKEGTKFESSYYVPLLQECINKNSVSEAQIVHGHIMKTVTQEDLFVMTFLINVYAKCGSMENAQKVFDNLLRRNVVSWTTLMTGYVQNSQPDIAIQIFQEMLEAGAYPTNYTLGTALNACSSLYSVMLGKQFHAYIIKYQIDFDTSVGNALCSFYSKLGNLESASKAFQRIREKNVISWTAVISACGDNGEAARGLRFFAEMLSEDIIPNEFTLTSVLSLCCTMLSLSVGAQIHSLSIKLGYMSSLPIKNSIMYLYLKCGCISEAEKLFDKTETFSLVTWNAMISGHSQMMDFAEDDLSAYRSGCEALNIFFKLNQSGMKPDLFTFSSILTVCSRLVAVEQGEQIHAQIIKSGFLSEVVVGTALINMYNKCGSIEKAAKAFVEMDTRTMILWTSMITGFSQHGQSQQALQLFEDMRLAGVRPNQITFVGVLSACSHAGMVKEALSYFEMMQKVYKIRPVMDHFACLIDMFVRLGRLNEAFDFIKKNDFEPNEFIWSLLMAGCRSHGNLELGFYAAEQLLKLKPKDTETYVLVLNMYLSAGRWKDVSRVRKMMKEEKLKKLHDWSWISIKNKVYSFKPNDKSHFHSADIYKSLENLLDQAKSLGYESLETLEVTDGDEEKTYSSTAYHSEKLAVAFGLLNTPNAAPIRVIKLLGMAAQQQKFESMFSSTVITLLWLLAFSMLCMVQSQSIVETLPGFPGKLPFKLETGYVGVGEADDVQLFYYFIESERNPRKDPLLLWLTGGPGCSGFSGLVYEIGPLSFNYENFDGNEPTFQLNQYSWTKVASIIFLDAPVGTGFSYSRTSQGYNMTDTLSAAQTYEFLRKWLLDHPKFLTNVLYVGGDSYSGITVPIVVQEIHNGNAVGNVPFVKLNGYCLGNPVTDRRSDVSTQIEYAHRVALISDELYESIKESCHGEYVRVDPENVQCLKDIQAYTDCISKLDPANILEPNCPLISPKSKGIGWDQAIFEENPMDILLSWSRTPTLWCRVYNYVLSYIWANDENVQNALGIRKGTKLSWFRCNKTLSYTYDVVSTIEYHRNLTNTAYRSLIYSGDQDLSVPYVGTQEWIRSLNMTITDDWQPWFVEGQIAGYTRFFTKNLYHMTFATVKGGGHTAPEYKPRECFAMVDRWLSYYSL